MPEDRGTAAPGGGHLPEPGPGGPGEPGPGLAASEDAVLRRTRDGWRVGGAELPDLTCAMVLADLLAAELAAPGAQPEPAATPAGRPGLGGPAGADPAGMIAEARPAPPRPAPPRPAPPRPAPPEPDGAAVEGAEVTGASETSRLRATIRQLEHALTARVRVEQAIGVLAERHRIQPRHAFEQLRTAARNRGRKVIDIAAEVVASATNPLLQLPEELSRPHQGTRRLRPSGRS